jgi:hypothetical protein
MLSRGTKYQERGDAYLDSLAPKVVRTTLVRRLENLGYRVTLEAVAT